MSYIHCPYDNYYKPGESLQTLFEKLIVQPFENHPLTQAWEYHIKNQTQKYHREDILQQGSANFSEGFKGLPPEDMVLLYCYYYMLMHLFSSYHIFRKYLATVSDKTIFIDFGCGPLTSGIAFWAAFAGHSDITYLGIDSSKAMRHKAVGINRHGPYEGKPFFTKDRVTSDWNRLSQSLDDYIIRGDQTQIILNFCYSLAHDTLSIEDLAIEDLSNVLIQFVQKYNQHKMFVTYQNPPIPEGYSLQTSKFHKNWYFLKTQLSMFQSRITQSNTERFSYHSLVDGLPLTFDFYFDILSNESSTFSNNPFESPTIF